MCSDVPARGLRNELVPAPIGLVDSRSDRGDVERVDEHGSPSVTSAIALPALVTTGVPQAIASASGMPKPS